MAIAFVQSVTASANAGSVTTAAITTTSGNFIAAVAADVNMVPGASGVTDSKSNTYTRDKAPSSAAGSAAVYHSGNITGGASHTFTYTRPSATNTIAICAAEFSGMGTTAVVDQSALDQATTTNPPHPSGSVTTLAATELIIGGASVSSNISATQSTLSYSNASIAASASQEGVYQGIAAPHSTTARRFKCNVTAANENIGIATFKSTSGAVVQSKTVQANATSITTAAMTTTSANFLVASPAAFARTFSGSPISDSKSNAWSNAWVGNTGTNGHSACYYAENISGGGSHTVTYTSGGAADFLALAVSECSGVASSSSLDKTVHTNSSTNPLDSGLTATLTQADELLVGTCSFSHTNGSGVILGFTPTDFIDIAVTVTATIEGCLLAYQIASATGAFQLYAANKSAPSTPLIDTAAIVTYALSAPSTVKERRTLSPIGARVGTRQVSA